MYQLLWRQGTSFDFKFQVRPKGQAGCCDMKVYFSTVDDPDNILKTGEVTVKINNPECITSVFEPTVELLELFPNPISNNFELTENQIVQSLDVYNAYGHLVKKYDAEGQRSFDASDLASGVYFVSLVGNENAILKTVRVVKQ